MFLPNFLVSRYGRISQLIPIGRQPSSILKTRRDSSKTKCTGLESITLPSSSSLPVQRVLDKIKANYCPELKLQHRVVQGTGQHLGLPIQWKLILGPLGAFIEQFSGEKFNSSWGTPGLPSMVCWEVDPNGICRSLVLDDMESCLLTTWIRSGQWLDPKILSSLHIELLPESPSAAEETVDLSVRMEEGKVQVKVQVETSSWMPVSMSQSVCGDEETWTFQQWKNFGSTKFLYPQTVIHAAHSGGQHEYQTYTSVEDPSLSEATFQAPSYTLIPENCSFDGEKSAVIPAWKSLSCHILVKPLINGEDVGYMILDTGASGLVIEKPKADELNLESYGELHVSGMAGKIPASFRKAKCLSLGPLVIQDPVFMEMEVPGLVTSSLQPVVGILGYDVFRRAVVEMKSIAIEPRTHVDLPPEPNYQVQLYDIQQFVTLPDHTNIHWLELHMITNLPHVEASFSINGTDVLKGLFMIDTGAGGASVMFMSKAVDQFGFHEHLQENSKTFVKGVGGDQSHRLAVRNGTVAWFQLGNKRFEELSCLFFNRSKMDISAYGCGILCMNMLHECRLVVDYARERIAVIQDD